MRPPGRTDPTRSAHLSAAWRCACAALGDEEHKALSIGFFALAGSQGGPGRVAPYRMEISQFQKVLEQALPVLRENRLRVELDAVDGMLLVH